MGGSWLHDLFFITFFMLFEACFELVFGAVWVPKWLPKPIKNPQERAPKTYVQKTKVFDKILGWFLFDAQYRSIFIKIHYPITLRIINMIAKYSCFGVVSHIFDCSC